MTIRFVLFTVCIALLQHAHAYGTNDWEEKRVQVTSFSWLDCGAATAPAHVKSISVSPDPVVFPGNITVSTSFSLATASPTDPSLSLLIEKKIAGFYVKVPCVADFGSCTFDNLCTDWAKNCPKYFAKFGLPCTCPIPANTYTVDNGVFDITLKFPPGSSGSYRITANINSASAGNIVCLKIMADAVIS